MESAALGAPADLTGRDLVAEAPVRVTGGRIRVALEAEDLAVVRLR